MADYGVQIFDERGRNWVDMVNPSWYIDYKQNIHGEGDLWYGIDTAKFKLRAIITASTENRDGGLSVTIDNNRVHYRSPVNGSFMVVMEPH